ncbi:gluconate 2-dehydrogenase subunit 3 family protein [Muricauda sp. ANG21]|uniref:gluconate 2-dehydrogenase subunit 3 family protein n=1 Tax=Allomuricauda sp. ANG21 TaxID=3042468 RepID=UPI003454A450
MERREAVVKISWVVASTLFMPSVFTVIQGCKEKGSKIGKLHVFNDEQCKLVMAISDTIIPKTKTPSASEVDVYKYLDLLLKDAFENRFRESFLDGLEQFNKNCQTFHEINFSSLSEEERNLYLEKVEEECIKRKNERNGEFPFFLKIKELVISIYFSTEEGIKQNLNYSPVPGPYIGEVEYKEGDKIMVGNQL